MMPRSRIEAASSSSSSSAKIRRGLRGLGRRNSSGTRRWLRVRSIAEVLLHASGANYNMYKSVGAQPPTGIDVQGIEQSTTDKAKIIATLKDSYAHAKKAITDMPDANLEKTLDWSGGKITQRGVLLFIVPHIAEHLGQLIAYARINGVVPPWSEDAKK